MVVAQVVEETEVMSSYPETSITTTRLLNASWDSFCG